MLDSLEPVAGVDLPIRIIVHSLPVKQALLELALDLASIVIQLVALPVVHLVFDVALE